MSTQNMVGRTRWQQTVEMMTNLSDEMFLVHVDENGITDGPTTLSFSRTPTVLLTFAANRFSSSASRIYQEQFGIGVMDWRMLVMLTRAPGCSVAEASKTTGIDKGAVSRSLSRLEKSGLAKPRAESQDERRKSWKLTKAGRVLHDNMLTLAVERQKKLLKGFTPEDVEQFSNYLRMFLTNLENLNEEELSNSQR